MRNFFTKKVRCVNCKFTEAKIDFIDYKDTSLLKYCLSERFKIMPRRLTGTSNRYQEMVEKEIKRVRHAAIIPYIVDRKDVASNPFEGL